MILNVTELGALVALTAGVILMARRGLAAHALALDTRAARGRALVDAAILGAGALLAEETCILAYDLYQYDAPWRLVADRVPLVVPFFWAFAILSAREICHGLGLRTRTGRAHPLAVGLVAIYDAALVEPIAVRAGLWSWNEPGLFDVPFIGLLGGGIHAAVASALLDALPGSRRVAVVALAPLATHALLLAAWWGGLRWGLRDPLPGVAGTALSVAVASGLTAIFFQWRRADRKVDLALMAPRLLAAALFCGGLAGLAGASWPLLLYMLPFAGPYLMATRYRRRSPA